MKRVAASIGAVLLLLLALHGLDPSGSALVLRYGRAIALSGVFALSCLAVGHVLVIRALGRTLPLDEHVSVAFPLGVFSFFLTSCVFGLLGLYGLPFLFLGPGVLLGLGASAFFRSVARLRRHLSQVKVALLPAGILRRVMLALAGVGLLLLWTSILTPQNASYDARWYHLAIAEEYVARGRIDAFAEGWIHGTVPHLASLVYVWGFSTGGAIFDRIETCAHIEFSVFLATLVGVSAMVRRIVRRRVPLAWASLLLFPGIYCYDSGLVLGADHFGALWAAPLFLLALRHVESPSRGSAILLGAVIAAALNTKFTAAILMPLPFAMLGARAWQTRSEGRQTWAGLALITGTVVLFTTPHWLKNAIFYGDPLFPLLRGWLPTHPWSLAGEAPYARDFNLHHPPFGASSVVEMARTLVTFSFIPHDFAVYHGDVPVFGSLFTLATPALLFLGSRRLRWVFGGAYLGLAMWFWVHQLDRYLQVLVPWMAAGTAAVMASLWQRGIAARAAIVTAVTVQVAWGSTVPFRFEHLGAATPIHQALLEFLKGDARDLDHRLQDYSAWEQIGRALPPGSRTLIHEEDIHIGIGAVTLRDTPGNQGAFYFGEPDLASSRQVWQRLKQQGVSHVAWMDRFDHGGGTLASSLVFFAFVEHHTKPLIKHAGFVVAALPETPPPDEEPGLVAYYPCDPDPLFSPGLYPLSALARSPGDSRTIASPEAGVAMSQAFERARFLAYDERCHGKLKTAVRKDFQRLAARGPLWLMERRP